MKDVSDVQTVRLARDVLATFPQTKYVARLRQQLSEGNMLSVARAEMPSLSGVPGKVALEYFAYNLCRKFPIKGVDTSSVALERFSQVEDHVSEYESRLMFRMGAGCHPPDWRLVAKIERLRKIIRDVLGPFNAAEAETLMKFGPGASTRLTRQQSDLYFKFWGKPQVTANCYKWAAKVLKGIPLWDAATLVCGGLEVVPGSRLTTVPKDAITDRCICIEADMNMFIQRGIGRMIKRRLKAVGIDISDQSLNQTLAALAQAFGLCTLDMSDASDCVIHYLMSLLLPPDWYRAMQLSRSPAYVDGAGNEKLFRKFSTMGNGFTFELETLVFYAIVKDVQLETNVAESTMAVYGDDIVCHASIAPQVVDSLTELGFKPNLKKSYTSGPFYESCGKHFYEGFDITPVYIRESLFDLVDGVAVTNASRMAWFANSIARWGARCYDLGVSSLSAWTLIHNHVPRSWQIPIPDGVGDGGIVYPSSPGVSGVVGKSGYWSNRYHRGFDYRCWTEGRKPLEDREFRLSYHLGALFLQEQQPWDPSIHLTKSGRAANPLGERGVVVWNKEASWSPCWPDVKIR